VVAKITNSYHCRDSNPGRPVRRQSVIRRV
jgi:hypothetical protein